MAALHLVEESEEDGLGEEPGSLDEVVQAYKPLIRHVVNRLTAGSSRTSILEYEDLLSYGTQGLIEAYHGFNRSRGAKFSTFAVPRIRGAVLDAIRAAHPMTRSLQKLSATIDRNSYDLTMELGRAPTLGEIACRMNMSEFELARASSMTSIRTVSLEGLAEISDGGVLDKFIEMADADISVSPEVVLENVLAQEQVAEAIDQLPDRERMVVSMYYLQSKSLRTIAGLLDVSESRVSQLRHRAVMRLREALSPYLPEAA